MTRTVQLSRYRNPEYHPGRSRATQILWFFVGLPVLRCAWLPLSGFRCWLLRRFGARIGTGVVCRPGMRVKYPWRLVVGDHSWIGEDCWIDNLADVTIGSNCCLSQASYLCTGNHDWSDEAFSLIVRGIRVEDGAWVGARATVLPGVTLHTGSIAAAGSVIARSIPPHEIHAGNPARFVRRRTMHDTAAARMSGEVTG
jgi:putative colanic acid biosynthesis acetyltransferase WcaF